MKKVIEPKHLKLAVLASGRGSNFDAICEAITRQDLDAQICILISDQEQAPVLQKAADRGIPAVYINPGHFKHREEYEQEILHYLVEKEVDFIVLAGYMRLVGKTLLDAFKSRIINIHPALLPSFPGLQAQKQAIDYGVMFSGCTVHFVDEGMDTGPIIWQALVPVFQDDDEDSLSERILEQEHKIYWLVLQLLASGKVFLEGKKVYIKEV